jgi:hypothetical protein
VSHTAAPEASTATTAAGASGVPYGLDPHQPASFGLTARELRAEIRRCYAAGWRLDELRLRFVSPSTLERHP